MTSPALLDLNAPLRWETEDGRRSGTEVIDVPKRGIIMFFDAHGPVMRVTDCAQVRWRCIVKMPLRGSTGIIRFRVTVVRRADDTFVSAIPAHRPEVMHCTLTGAHDGCEPWLCARVADRVEAITRLLIQSSQ